MENEGLHAAIERINAGAQVPEIEPSQIEHVWEIMRRIPLEKQHSTATGLTMARANPEFAPRGPEEQAALMVRYALLVKLLEHGILTDYMENESLRKQVFATAASIPQLQFRSITTN